MKIGKILLSSMLIALLFLIVVTPGKNPDAFLGEPQSNSADSASLLDDFLQVAIYRNSEWCRAQREEIKQQYLLPTFPNYLGKISSVSSTSYTGHDPIFIDDDTDFGSLGYNFPGNGTSDSPYEITGWDFTNSSEILFHIENTTAYFQIYDNLLNGITHNFDAIFLKNVTHGLITNNTIHNSLGGMSLNFSPGNSLSENIIHDNKEDGISLNNSNYNNIFNNEIRDNGGNPGGNGLYADPSNYNIIFNNSIFNNSLNGIFLNSSEYNIISNNNVSYNHEDGVFLYNSSNNLLLENMIHNNGVNPGGNGLYADPSNHNVIFNNTIFKNDENGIFLNSSEYNIISDNNVSYNHEDGVFLYNSCFNAISNNLIHNNGGNPGGNGLYADPSNHNVINSNYIFANSINGIYLHEAKNNTIFSNKLENNVQFGINISSSTGDNQIKLNDFLNNTLEGGVSQARDDGLANSFDFNYWNDHDNTDMDSDGIADKEYSINGTAGNKDEHPSVTPLIVPPPSSIITITNPIPIVKTKGITAIVTTTVTKALGWPFVILILSLITIISLRRFKRIS